MKRFWDKVDKNGPTAPHMETPCWLWKPCPSRNRGNFWLNGKYESASRVSYCLENEKSLDDIKDIIIRHKCDNMKCCNPDHLLEGTPQDNINDMMERKRHAKHTGKLKIPHYKGCKHQRARLNEEQVKEVRLLLNDQKKNKAKIARDYNVSRHVINCIDYGLTYIDNGK